MTTKNLWGLVKTVLRVRFIAIQAYLKKLEKNQINNLTLHLKQLKKEETKNPRIKFSSIAHSCLTLCDPMNCTTPGHPVHHQLPEFTQTRVH